MKNALGLVRALGGGIAVASNEEDVKNTGMRKETVVPDEALPENPYATDIQKFCAVVKCQFLGQDESDPSFLSFKDEGGKLFKMPQAVFIAGFRGSNEAEDDEHTSTAK